MKEGLGSVAIVYAYLKAFEGLKRYCIAELPDYSFVAVVQAQGVSVCVCLCMNNESTKVGRSDVEVQEGKIEKQY